MAAPDGCLVEPWTTTSEIPRAVGHLLLRSLTENSSAAADLLQEEEQEEEEKVKEEDEEEKTATVFGPVSTVFATGQPPDILLSFTLR